jgi:hypothetical protein
VYRMACSAVALTALDGLLTCSGWCRAHSRSATTRWMRGTIAGKRRSRSGPWCAESGGELAAIAGDLEPRGQGARQGKDTGSIQGDSTALISPARLDGIQSKCADSRGGAARMRRASATVAVAWRRVVEPENAQSSMWAGSTDPGAPLIARSPHVSAQGPY